ATRALPSAGFWPTGPRKISPGFFPKFARGIANSGLPAMGTLPPAQSIFTSLAPRNFSNWRLRMEPSHVPRWTALAEGLRIAAGGGACALGCLAIVVMVGGALLIS